MPGYLVIKAELMAIDVPNRLGKTLLLRRYILCIGGASPQHRHDFSHDRVCSTEQQILHVAVARPTPDADQFRIALAVFHINTWKFLHKSGK